MDASTLHAPLTLLREAPVAGKYAVQAPMNAEITSMGCIYTLAATRIEQTVI